MRDSAGGSGRAVTGSSCGPCRHSLTGTRVPRARRPFLAELDEVTASWRAGINAGHREGAVRPTAASAEKGRALAGADLAPRLPGLASPYERNGNFIYEERAVESGGVFVQNAHAGDSSLSASPTTPVAVRSPRSPSTRRSHPARSAVVAREAGTRERASGCHGFFNPPGWCAVLAPQFRMGKIPHVPGPAGPPSAGPGALRLRRVRLCACICVTTAW